MRVVPGPCPGKRSCDHTETHTQSQKHTEGEHTHARQHRNTHMGRVNLGAVCTYTLVYKTHTHCFSSLRSCEHTRGEYEMSMCNYMANVVMIRRLNISAVLCCSGSAASSILRDRLGGSDTRPTGAGVCLRHVSPARPAPKYS